METYSVDPDSDWPSSSHIGATYNGNANRVPALGRVAAPLAFVATIQAAVVVAATGVGGDMIVGRLLGAIGLGVLGPALLLPARRRRREAG
jgi:hypothetical protein